MVIIVMGVSGSGKSTVGQLLGSRLNLPFWDADHFHPDSNVKKMQSGTPLNDEDRKPWLENLNSNIKEWNRKNGAILACSALKKSYRDVLRNGLNTDEIFFVFLEGTKLLISKRLKKRTGHYMPPELLDSQFAALEEPVHALTCSIEPDPQEVVDQIISNLSEVNQTR